MEFNLLTFVFELINFLVLIWLLKKILYTPVIKVLSERRTFIAQRLDAARQKELELEQLQSEYQNLLQEMDTRRQHEMASLNAELEQEKARLQKQLQAEIKTEKEHNQVFLEHEKQAMLQDVHEEAVQAALNYSLRLLDKVQDPHLQEKLVALALETLNLQTPEQRQETIAEIKERGNIELETAFASGDPLTSHVLQALQDAFGFEVQVNLQHQPELKAGLRLYLGSRLIDASLLGQLEQFRTEISRNVQQ